MDDFLSGLGIFVGVFAGVVAGTGVTLFTQWVQRKVTEKQTIRNLKFELQLNVEKAGGWLNSLDDYRNAVNSGNPDLFTAYFDLSRAVLNTFNYMFTTGLLYNYLGHEDIGRLQVIAAELSANWELLMNNQIATDKRQLAQNQTTPAAVATHIMFWETKFKDHRRTLQEILGKFE